MRFFLELWPLILLVSAVFALSRYRRTAFFFEFLPAAFWCYAVPLLLSQTRSFHRFSVSYVDVITYGLPVCLILLLLGVDLQALRKLGKASLIAMTAGAAGIGIGCLIGYGLLRGKLAEDAWKGVGALSASWIGGNANMVAVKAGLNTPDAVFAPFLVIDSTVTYLWMLLLIACARFQGVFDRWAGVDREFDHETLLGTPGGMNQPPRTVSPFRWKGLLILLGAWILAWGLNKIGARLAVDGTFLTPAIWVYLMATAVGMLLSMTALRTADDRFVENAARWLLYLILAVMGIQAGKIHLGSLPWYLGFSGIVLLVQAGLLLIAGRLFHLPLFLLATASQANVGGVASTPVVAGVYRPHLTALGLLLAIAGNVIGTQAGLLIAWACHLLT